MTYLLPISELQATCWAIERISKQLTTLITLTHPYQPLLRLLQHNTLEVCALLKKYQASTHFTELHLRIHELTLLIRLMRDYAFEGVKDEIVDSHLTQIKEGLEQCLALITNMSDVETLLQERSVEGV